MTQATRLRVRITRIDPDLPLPCYATPGAVAFDLASRVDLAVLPGELATVPTGVIIATPPGYALLVVSRSSTPRRGIVMPHGLGVIDTDYCGPDDEVRLLFWNRTDAPITIRRGERIAQGLIVPVPRVEWEETVAPTTQRSRGGFGSTRS